MKINLRKASALQSVIRSAISEQNSLVTGSINMPLWNVSDESMAQERGKQVNALSTVERLEDLLVNMREQVGKVNVKAGVNSLLAEQTKVTSQIGRLTRLIAHSEVMPSTDALQRQVDAIKARAEKSPIYRDDSITVGCFSIKDLERFKNSLVKLRRRQVEINDALIAANISNEISISDNDWTWLENQGLV